MLSLLLNIFESCCIRCIIYTYLFSALVHDAVLAWAMAVNKTIDQGFGYNDGFKILANLYNLSFHGMTGDVVINSVGDRSPDYYIQSYQNGSFIPLLRWSALQHKLFKVYNPEQADDWTGLYWFGNATNIPSASPRCGWKGEFCPNAKYLQLIIVAIIILVLLAIVGSIMAFFLLRIR